MKTEPTKHLHQFYSMGRIEGLPPFRCRLCGAMGSGAYMRDILASQDCPALKTREAGE